MAGLEEATAAVNKWLSRQDPQKEYERFTYVGGAKASQIREVFEQLKTQYREALDLIQELRADAQRSTHLLTASREDNQKLLAMCFRMRDENKELRRVLNSMYEAIESLPDES